MSNVFLIAKTYFKRSWLNIIDPIALIGIPLGMVILNLAVFNGQMPDRELINGYDPFASFLASSLVIAFQFFSGMNLFLWYYSDLEGAVKDRLYSTPTSRASFIFGKALGSIAFSLIQGIVVIVVTWAFFDANWGNPIILILTLLTISIISHLVSAITYILSKSKSQANAIGYIYSFGLMIISGTFLVNFSILGLQDNPVVRFLETRGTPISLGWRAIQYSGPILDDMSEAIFNVGLLAGIMVVLAIIVAILAKRRRSA